MKEQYYISQKGFLLKLDKQEKNCPFVTRFIGQTKIGSPVILEKGCGDWCPHFEYEKRKDNHTGVVSISCSCYKTIRVKMIHPYVSNGRNLECSECGEYEHKPIHEVEKEQGNEKVIGNIN